LGWLMPTYFVDNCRGLADPEALYLGLSKAEQRAIVDISVGEGGVMTWQPPKFATRHKSNFTRSWIWRYFAWNSR